MVLIKKITNSVLSLLLPILIWQSYWCNNFYASNILQFLVISLFLMSTVASVLIFYTPEDKKLELNINRRKLRFDNKVLNFLNRVIDFSCVVAFVGFGHFVYAFMLIVSMACIQVYVDELEKVS